VFVLGAVYCMVLKDNTLFFILNTSAARGLPGYTAAQARKKLPNV
jgi:hypothetical protein